MDKVIYGGDTETVRGKPNSFQFYSEDVACSDIKFVNERTARRAFIDWCASRKRNVQHIVYVHNLAFDLIEFLWGSHEKLIADGSEFAFTAHGWDVRGFYGTPTYCSVSRGHDRRIILVDSYSFFKGSLAKAASLYCPTLPKLRRVSGLGDKRFTAKDAAFCAYAMRDAEVTYHVGRAIDELHNEFDLKQCISAADLAARVFRHRYLTYTIPQPTDDIVYAALDSYHGGKNNLTVKAGWYEDVTSIDISSAYPDAMRSLPAFSNARLYKRYKPARRVASVPEYGVYCVSGRADDCPWPVVFDHAFKPMRRAFVDTWIQGAEVNEGLASGELHISKIRGWYYDAEKDHQAPALRGFCDEFYKRKSQERNRIKRQGYKDILNSVSGKFIQTRKRTLRAYVDIDSGEVSTASELVAGGMFHPFIASAITAHTRARIHRIEHHYQALHTATDGIFTQRNSGVRGTFRCVGKATRLGELEADKPSPVLLVRNKCYIKYYARGEKREPDAIKSGAFAGQWIKKYALHGFQGRVNDLERLVATGRRKYTAKHVNRLKESVSRGLIPNEFVDRDYNLKVGPIHVQHRTSARK